MQKFSFSYISSFVRVSCIILAVCFMTSHAFAAPSVVFEDETGQQHSLKDYKGKTVIILAWASWCPACAREVSALEVLYKELLNNKTLEQNNLVILAISQDSSSDAVAAFRQRYEINNLPLFLDKSKNTAKSFGFSTIPYGIILYPSGTVMSKLSSGNEGKSLIESLLSTALQQ